MNVTDVNDNPPVFYPLRYYTVIPDTAGPGYSVVTVMASDADIGVNARIRYELPAQTSGITQKFSVDSVTGEIKLTGRVIKDDTFMIQVHLHPGGGYSYCNCCLMRQMSG